MVTKQQPFSKSAAGGKPSAAACFAVSIFLALIASVPAQAGAREDVLSAIAQCGSISDDRAWLDCLNRAQQPMRNQLGLSATASTPFVPPATNYPPPPAYAAQPPVAAVPSAPQPRQSGGLIGSIFGGGVVQGNTRLASYKFDGSGLFTVTLANGQVWQQMQGDDYMARWREPASRYAVIIRQGALGSYNLQLSGDPRIYKVRRIR